MSDEFKLLQLRLDQVRLDSGCQYRVNQDPDYRADLAAAYRAKVDIPDPTVFWDRSHYWMADGFNRHGGATEAGLKTLVFQVYEGTQRDAILWAFGERNPNSEARGLRIRREDKRAKVHHMLNDAEWGGWDDETSKWTGWNNAEIARRCCVSDTFVAIVRRELEAKHWERLHPNVWEKGSDSVKPGRKRKVRRKGTILIKSLPDQDEARRVNQLFDRCEARTKETIQELRGVGDNRSLKANQRALESLDKTVRAYQRVLEALAAGRDRLTG